MTAFAEVIEDLRGERPDGDHEAGEPDYRRAFASGPTSAVSLLHSSSTDDRWSEVSQLIEDTLSTSVAFFVDQLG